MIAKAVALVEDVKKIESSASSKDALIHAAEGAAKTTVTVYSNGFVVGDGPFRASDGSPENEAFLRDVGRGLVPRSTGSVSVVTMAAVVAAVASAAAAS